MPSPEEKLTVELADTPKKQRQGLMHRRTLAKNQGMLFTYSNDQARSFWMKDTYIPLSIAFLSPEGKIRKVEDMNPKDKTKTAGNCQYALEVNQGWFDQNDLTAGDTLNIRKLTDMNKTSDGNPIKKAARELTNSGHIFITGVPGAGKTTFADKLAKQKKLPVIHGDLLPSVYNTYPGTAELREKLKLLDRPSIIEGAQVLGLNPEELKGSQVHTLEVPKKELVRRLINRGWTDSGGVHYGGPEDKRKTKEMVKEMNRILKNFKKRNAKVLQEVKQEQESPVQKAAQELTKTDTVYHGSPKKLNKLKPKSTHGDPGVGNRIFASPSLVMALAYMGRKWGDRDLNQSGYYKPGKGQVWTLEEMRPNALQNIFGKKSGYLYHLPKSDFKKEPTKESQVEVTADKPVTPLQREKVDDVLEKLKQTDNLELKKYDPSGQSYESAVNRMTKRMTQMNEEDRQQYLKWIGEQNPELKEKLEDGSSKQAGSGRTFTIEEIKELGRKNRPPEDSPVKKAARELLKVSQDSDDQGVIGIDLDGTLAEYHEFTTADEIGPPIPVMKKRVQKALDDGKNIKILTARVAPGRGARTAREAIRKWTKKHFGQEIPSSAVKGRNIKEVWDDRAVNVSKNTGHKKRQETKTELEKAACDLLRISGQ